MKQFLKYYYNIDVNNICEKDYNYYFYNDNNLFYIEKNIRTKEEVNDLYEISRELNNKKFPVSTIIINKFGEIVSVYNDIEYILLLINVDTSSDIDLNEISKINKLIDLSKDKKNLYRNNWAYLWETKIDYFEYQIKELGYNKNIILNSFSYFIGLAENAISVANIAELKYKNDIYEIGLSRKRIFYPNMTIDYFNPLYFIFDLEIRDVAEYIKSKFFYADEESIISEFIVYLKNNNMSNYEANMLFARLLYPSYYFDIYEKIIEDKEEEEKLFDVLNKVNDYEIFLRHIYNEMIKKYNIEKIEWIINKKEL